MKNAPTIKQVLWDLHKFCKDSEIVGHNVSFDLGFLNYYGAKYEISFKGEYADTLAMSRQLLRNKLVNYRLATVAEYFKLKFKGHRALNDALVTVKIFLKLIDLQEKQEKKRNSWFEKYCKNCQEKCLLYKDKGKWLREITPSVYRKTLQWLLDKDTITLVMLQREMKMSYPLANSVLNTLILDGVRTPVDYGEDKKNIYALDGANIMDIALSDRFVRKVNVGEVKMATNAYGKGRSFYITGLPYSANNAKLLYRAILWTASKEDMDKKSYCENPLTEAHFYGDRYAVINNTDKEQTTIFYDIKGKAQTLTLNAYEIKWL